VKIRTVRHRGLKRLIEDDDTRGVRADQVSRVRNILSALIVADDVEGIGGPPGWRIHVLTGDRAGTWSISVSGNWRVTFRLDGREIIDLNLEDYH
jgi:proteic killer suppression protein